MELKITNEYLDDLMVRMAHHSTAIEGNSLTMGETKSVLIDNYIPRAMNMRELYEVLNYKNLMPFLRKAVEEQQPISISFIKDLHRIICDKAIGSVPGEFKTIPNGIIGANFEPTPPYLVIPTLEDWRLNLEAQLEAAKDDNDKIVEAICRQHVAFEHIHPFPDGNGRVGRALMVYSCFQKRIIPIVVPVERKPEYIHYLNNDDVAGLTCYALDIQKTESNRIKLFQGYADAVFMVHDVPDGDAEEHQH